MNRFQITAYIESRLITHVVPAENLIMAKLRFKAAYNLEALEVRNVLHLGIRRKPYERQVESAAYNINLNRGI